jgi:hypothetical protein
MDSTLLPFFQKHLIDSTDKPEIYNKFITKIIAAVNQIIQKEPARIKELMTTKDEESSQSNIDKPWDEGAFLPTLFKSLNHKKDTCKLVYHQILYMVAMLSQNEHSELFVKQVATEALDSAFVTSMQEDDKQLEEVHFMRLAKLRTRAHVTR